MRRPTAGNVLIGGGIVALWCAAAVVIVSMYAEWRQTTQIAFGPGESLPSRVQSGLARMAAGPDAPVATSTPEIVRRSPTATPATARVQRLDSTVASESAPIAEASGRPASFGEPDWITIPKLDLDVGVTPVGVQGGEYLVPDWAVGHHEDSPNPGEPGNAVLNGHLETIASGHVFSQLSKLKAGDAVYTYTGSHRLTWRVSWVSTVRSTDRAFFGPRPDRRLTLYTCAGTFNPIAQDYTHRLVVVAYLVESADRTS